MFLQVSVILSTGGACVVARGHMWLGGMHGCGGRVCMVAVGWGAYVVVGGVGGHSWLWGACMVARGACVVVGGMHGCGGRGCVWLWGVCMVGGCAWLPGGMVGRGRGCAWLQGGHAWLRGACVVVGGCVWLWGACMVVGGMCGCLGVHRIRRDTVSDRAVRILLECILVYLYIDVWVGFTNYVPLMVTTQGPRSFP